MPPPPPPLACVATATPEDEMNTGEDNKSHSTTCLAAVISDFGSFSYCLSPLMYVFSVCVCGCVWGPFHTSSDVSPDVCVHTLDVNLRLHSQPLVDWVLLSHTICKLP